MNPYADNRQFNTGRPRLPEGTRREQFGMTLPPYVITKIREQREAYGSHANVVVAAMHALFPDLKAPAMPTEAPRNLLEGYDPALLAHVERLTRIGKRCTELGIIMEPPEFWATPAGYEKEKRIFEPRPKPAWARPVIQPEGGE